MLEVKFRGKLKSKVFVYLIFYTSLLKQMVLYNSRKDEENSLKIQREAANVLCQRIDVCTRWIQREGGSRFYFWRFQVEIQVEEANVIFG